MASGVASVGIATLFQALIKIWKPNLVEKRRTAQVPVTRQKTEWREAAHKVELPVKPLESVMEVARLRIVEETRQAMKAWI